MTNYFIVQRLGNSGPTHWQTFFENSGDNFHRINQQEWDTPDCNDWISTIDKTLSHFDLTNIILIGHSLGCPTILHWASKYGKKIKGTLLVAPTDLEGPQYALPTKGFEPIPMTKMNFRSLVVASTSDPWVSIERAKYFADNWGSILINIGNAGHINIAAGFGKWPQGLEILKTLG